MGKIKSGITGKHLARLTSRLIGAPYKLGGMEPETGMDCLSVVLAACDFWKVTVPEEFEGYTRDNYAERYEEDPAAAKETFFRLLGELGEEIPPVKAFAGDLLVVRTKTDKGVAIHGGADRVISAFFEKGVKSANIRAYTVEKAYRLRRE